MEPPFSEYEAVETERVFDENATELAVQQRSVNKDVVEVIKVPSFLVHALMRYPDSFNGTSESWWHKNDEEAMRIEELHLVKKTEVTGSYCRSKACEQSWGVPMAVQD